MTEDKLEVKDSLPLDTGSQTTSIFIEEREVTTQDGGTMTLQFLASMDLQKEAEQISLQFLPYTLLASFLISLLVAYIYARTIVAPILEIKRVTRRMMDLMPKCDCAWILRMRLVISRSKSIASTSIS